MAEQRRILHHHAGGVAIDQRGEVFIAVHIHRRGCVGLIGLAHQRFNHIAVMRMQATRQHGLLALGDPLRHQHGFAAGGGAVIQRGIGHIHAGDQRHLGLEFKQVLQRALGDFRLVGRVGGEEFAALDQVVGSSRDVMPVGAGAEKTRRIGRRQVLRRQRRDMALHFQLALMRRQVDLGIKRLGRHILEQGINIADTDSRQHGAAVGLGLTQITHGINLRAWRDKRRRRPGPSARPTRPGWQASAWRTSHHSAPRG